MNEISENCCYLDFQAVPPAIFRGGILCIGNFDGVHLGHQSLLAKAKELGQKHAAPVVPVTFDPHPMQLLAPASFQTPLTTIPQRVQLLQRVGADRVVILATTPALLSLSPEYFFETIVRFSLQARGIVEGFNFRFGKDRAGNNELLEQWCRQNQIDFCQFPAISHRSDVVSTSRIRCKIAEGDFSSVTELLGRPYSIKGTVVSGAKRGRTIGFPTANLAQIATMLPPPGVYASEVIVGNQAHAAAVNIGGNPTFGELQPKVEVHLIDFAGDLYGQSLELALIAAIRPVKQFQDATELIAQIHTDIQQAKNLFTTMKAPQR
ncbi:MAG: bifunctional riboflavin kinase/FAD synthetase [Zavarzinella sp.]